MDNDDYVALTQIVHYDDDFFFEAAIALMLNFPSGQQNLSSAARVLVSHCEVQGYNYSRFHDNVIVKGYTNLLQYVICQEEFPTEWNCMDVISLCLPIIDTADTGDLGVICDLVGNVPFACKILAKTLSSSNSAKHIVKILNEKSKLKIIADKAGKVEKDRLLDAIDLAFQFVKPECQISAVILIKFDHPFTLDKASLFITADMMSKYLNYTDFDLYERLLELTAMSFLEIRTEYRFELEIIQFTLKNIFAHFGYPLNFYQEVEYYHFHELSVDFLKNSNNYFELTEILQAYWKNLITFGFVNWTLRLDDNDYVALTQIANHDDSFSFEASIALIINFYHSRQNLSSAVHILVSHCEVQDLDYNYTRLKTDMQSRHNRRLLYSP